MVEDTTVLAGELAAAGIVAAVVGEPVAADARRGWERLA